MEAFQAHAASEHIKQAGASFKQWVSAPTVVRVLKPEYVGERKPETAESQNVVATLYIKPDCIETGRPVLEKLIEGTRKEEGMLRYDFYADIKQPGVFVVI